MRARLETTEEPGPLSTAKTARKATPRRQPSILGMVLAARQFTAGVRGRMALAVLLGIGVTAADALGIAMIAPIIQTLAGDQHFADTPLLGRLVALLDGYTVPDRLAIVGVAITLLAVVRGLLQYANLVVNHSVSVRARIRLMTAAHRAYMQSSMAFVGRFEHGRIATLVKNHPGRVASFIQNVTNLATASLVCAAYLVLMGLLSWKITLVCMVFFGVIVGGYQLLFRRRLAQAGHDMIEANVAVSSRFYEFYNGLKVIKQLNAEERSFARLRDSFAAVERAIERQHLLLALSSPFLLAATGAFVGLALTTSALAFRDSPASWLAELLIFILIASRLSAPVQAINQARATIVNTFNSVHELDRALRGFARHGDVDGNRRYAGLAGGVSFQGIRFAYTGKATPALRGLSLTVPERAFVAIVGPSGAGKTTLVDLLMRIYRPSEGRITVGGVPLDELEIGSFREHVGLVPQEPFLLHDSVLENIRFGRAINDELVKEAARQADADEFIRRLPKGYDEVIGDRGLRLSGGQRQRLGIARALAGDPDLIVLDEATSNLDSLSERAIQETIKRLRGNKTVIAVAHRLATVQQADLLYVLDHGQVVQEGTHAQLSARAGIYRDLVASQLLG